MEPVTAVRVDMPADEPLLRGARPDDADAFAVAVPAGDDRTAEQWLRSGLESSPRLLRAVIVAVHRRVLRLRLGPMSSPAHVLGWDVDVSEPDVAMISASGPLLRAVSRGSSDRRSSSQGRATSRVATTS